MQTLNKNLSVTFLLCLACLVVPATALGQARSFMVELGSEPSAAPSSGSTTLQMHPGSTLDIAVFFEDSASGVFPGLNALQLIFPWSASPLGGATGTVEYIDNLPVMGGSDSILMDIANPDWIFAKAPRAEFWPVNYNETRGVTFGTVYIFGFDQSVAAGPEGNVPNPGGPNYAAQFSFSASPDASGVFELTFNTPESGGSPPFTAYFHPGGGAYGGPGYVSYQPLAITVVPCATHTQCADTNSDGLRDDSCTWWACDAGACLGTSVPFADLGGSFGRCFPDQTADNHDRFHALNCFSNGFEMPTYFCENGSGNATNVDAGGSFGTCCPDGVCDGNDVFHVLHSFAGDNPCQCPANFVCPPGPMPDGRQGAGEPRVVGRTTVQLAAVRSTAAPGELIEVDVFLVDAFADLRGYQLHVEATGGKRGTLNLVDIAVHDRPDHAFAGLADWRAFNIDTRQMLAGLDSEGIASGAGAYLATFTFRASADAAGTFSVDLLHDDRDPAQRTFIFPTPAGAKIEVESSNPALITVAPPPARVRGRS